MKKNNYPVNKMLYAFFLLLFLSFNLQAQDNTKVKTSGGGGFTIGYGYMDVSALQKFIPEGIGNFNNQHLLIGGTGHGFIENIVIGGSGSGMIGSELSTDSFKYSLGGGYGTFDLGYLIVNKEKIKVYPMLGIGGGGYSIRISENQSLSVNEIVSNPAREINVSAGRFIFDFSMNLNLVPALDYNEDTGAYGGIMTGLKVGYIYSLPSSGWSYSGGAINGGPDFGFNMIYAKLIVGGFGYNKNK